MENDIKTNPLRDIRLPFPTITKLAKKQLSSGIVIEVPIQAIDWQKVITIRNLWQQEIFGD
jgi:hypothetical protein